MASNHPEMTNSKFHNWIKSGLAIKYTKEGLQDAVIQEMQSFHNQCYYGVLTRKGLPVGTICNLCTTESIMICGTNNTICKRIGQKCLSKHRPCSLGICEDQRDNIIKAHRYSEPSFKNSDAQKWCVNYFEVMKCFLPRDGYTDKSTVDEIDFNGIISVVISFKYFQNKIAENLNTKNNIFKQAREIGRMFRHTSNCELSDTDFESHIDVLSAVLKDPKYFAAFQQSKDAVCKLEELRSVSWKLMNTKTSEILNDIENAIKDHRETALGCIKEQTETSLKAIETAKGQLKLSNRVEVEEIVKEIISDIHYESNTTINSSIENQLSEPLLGSESVFFRGGEVEILPNQNIRIKTCLPRRQHRMKKVFRRRIVQHYEMKKSKLQVSPLLQEEDAPLRDLYVFPSMKILEHHKIQSKDVSVNSYTDIFFKGNKECKNIYITGDAGIGKTAFCLRMILVWCFKPEIKTIKTFACCIKKETMKKENLFSHDDLQVMKSFEFLFYISLRDTSLCHVEDMIMQQLGFGCSRSYLTSILDRYKCLIIMDGLDEWNHPPFRTHACPPGDKVPHRQAYKNCTFITTSRASKLDMIRLSTSEIDQLVAIIGIGTDQYQTLVKAVVDILNMKLNKDNNSEAFIAFMKQQNLLDLTQIPIVVMQLICQWYEEDSLDTRKSIVYGKTMQMLFTRSKTMELKSLPELSLSFPKQWKTVPVLQHLCYFAYVTLFPDDAKSKGLVFNNDDLDQNLYGLKRGDMNTLLSAGIISRNKVLTTLMERKFKLQFIHKSFHEFVAAVYIAMEQDESYEVLNYFSNVSHFLEFSNVLVFLASLCPNVFQHLNQILLKLLRKDEYFVEYRKIHFSGFIFYKSNIRYIRYKECHASLKALQSLFISCARESKQLICTEYAVHVADVYIDDEKQIEEPYFGSLLKSETILSLSTCGIIKNLSFVDNLVKFCSKGPCSEFYVSNLEKFTHLQCLVISICKLQTSLNLYQLKELESLTLFDVLLDQKEDCEISKVQQYLQAQTKLTQISLVEIECACAKHNGTSTMENSVTLDISKHKDLITLDLRRVPVVVTNVNTCELESCIIETDVEIHQSLLVCLECAPKLECLTIDLDNCKSSSVNSLSVGESLTKIIPTLHCLRNIKLVNIDFGNGIITLSSQMKALENIKLWWCTLSVPSITSTIDTLPVTGSKLIIELNRCKVLSNQDRVNQLQRLQLKLKSEDRFEIMKYSLLDTQELSFELSSVSNSESL